MPPPPTSRNKVFILVTAIKMGFFAGPLETVSARVETLAVSS
jgi:hypothetical protein